MDSSVDLVADGVWSYSYDGENRLVQMVSQLPASQGYSRLQLDLVYDYLGRRVQKTVTNLDGGSVTLVRKFVYDGWNLVAELDGAGALVRSYTWGPGVGGGAGGLVQITSGANSYFPGYDGNGNVSSLTRDDGTLVAVYEYSPFGELLRGEIRAGDTFAPLNPFRFSTRYADTETGLVYYGYRYYSPRLGRFINRDPIEEQGGVNLYAFVGNNPVSAVDVLGLQMYCRTYLVGQYWVPRGPDGYEWRDITQRVCIEMGEGQSGSPVFADPQTQGSASASPGGATQSTAPNKEPTPCEKLKAGIDKVGQSIHSAIDSFSDINSYFADANTNAWLSLGQSAGFAAYGITGVAKGLAANAAKTSANVIRAGAGDVPIGIWTSTGRTATVGTAAFAKAAAAETAWRNTSALVVGSQEAIPDVAQYLAADLYDPVSRVLDPWGNLAETQLRTGDALSKQTAATVKQMQSSYKALQELYDQNCR